MTEVTVIKSKSVEIQFEAILGEQVKLLYIGALRDKNIDVIDVDVHQLSGKQQSAFSLVEVRATGDDTNHKGVKLTSSELTDRLEFVSLTVIDKALGKLVTILQRDPVTDLEVISFLLLYDEAAVVKSWTTLSNQGKVPIGIEYVSSFAYTGIVQLADIGHDYGKNVRIGLPSNEWNIEAQWHFQRLQELGFNFLADGRRRQPSTKRITTTNNSSWSCSEWSPNGILENTNNGQVAMWQIENNGAWHSELDDAGDGLLLRLDLFGPEELDNHWWKNLQPGTDFTSVPIAFTQLEGTAEQAIQEMTKYRRLIRRSNQDNEDLPVIFNDYMNCLFGNPTTDNEIPLIKAAASIGAEYYVIDCGWYADGYWWDSVGEWRESKNRFPNGLTELTDRIRALGMIPGLWLEIEAMGKNSQLAKQLPDSWFFCRHGKRVLDVNRYHLDFRNPDVRQYATAVVSRLVNEYHVGYIKMDYNIMTGIGSDVNADSYGDALLNHCRAYLAWLDNIFKQFPDIVIENCGSGGMRHDYAMLQRHSIQSMSDQNRYDRMSQIAAASATVVTPEQLAIWSYPMQSDDEEKTIYNMINTMLARVHQSGEIGMLSEKQLRIVKDAITVYKSYRRNIPNSLPIWPNGIPTIDDSDAVYGLVIPSTGELLLAVWNSSNDAKVVNVDLTKYLEFAKIDQIFPCNDVKVKITRFESKVQFHFPHGKMARLYRIHV